jgi:hypothetical protein
MVRRVRIPSVAPMNLRPLLSVLCLSACGAWSAGGGGLAAATTPAPADDHIDFSRGFLLGGAISDCTAISMPVILLREGKESPEHEQLLFTYCDAQLVAVAQALAEATPDELQRQEIVLPLTSIDQLLTVYQQLRGDHHWTNKNPAVEAQLGNLARLVGHLIEQQARNR